MKAKQQIDGANKTETWNMSLELGNAYHFLITMRNVIFYR